MDRQYILVDMCILGCVLLRYISLQHHMSQYTDRCISDYYTLY